MTYLVPKLNKRIQIKMPIQTENSDGGFDQTYLTLTTVWAGIENISDGQYIRSIQSEEKITHAFLIRHVAVENLGKAFTNGFDSGFESIADLNPIKSDWFIFMQSSSSVKGRLFRVRRSKNKDERNIYLKIYCEEIEEQGTGISDD